MLYLKSAVLPNEVTEYDYVVHEKRSFIHTAYPFKIFPGKGLTKLVFDDITMFYGGNGSGKSTLINVLAQKMKAARYSPSVELQIQLADFIAATIRVTRSQFIIATHSPIFLSMKSAKIYNLDDDPVSVCKWTELPNVRRLRDFFVDRWEE